MRRVATWVSIMALFLAVGGTASAQELWGTGSPDWGTGASGPGPIIFQFNPYTGIISKTLSFESYNWMWISGIADNGVYLYAFHNTYNSDPESFTDTHDFKIAKIDRVTGAVLSDTWVSGFLGQVFSQPNALDFHEGRLYAIENATSGSALRGFAFEILLNADGDVVGATVGAYVAPYPDCGLDFHGGLWYATSWGYTPAHKQGSIIYTSPDIMNINFVQVGTGDSAVSGIGMIDGWEFDDLGNLIAVSWYDPTDWIANEVFQIDLTNRTASKLCDLTSQMPGTIISLDGLSDIVRAQSVKQNILNDLYDLLDNSSDKFVADKLNKAIGHVENSLKPAYWLDADHLDSKQGDKVFQEEKDAVVQLLEIVKKGTDVQGLVNTLVGIDGVITKTAISEALAGGATKAIKQAQDEIAKAEAFVAKGNLAAAIEQYRNAWKKIQ
jgi:hypothetical protein